MLNIVTAFKQEIPHMGQLLHETIHVIDTIRARSPVGNTILPLNHAVFQDISSETVVALVGCDASPVLRLGFKFNSIERAWELARPLDTYMDDYAEEILKLRRDPQTH